MERKIQELEKLHVTVYKELLEVLDELYLVQLGNVSLNKEARRTAEVRRQLQMSLEKSVVILRALERLGQRDTIASQHQGPTTEGILAERLGKLMDANYKLDHEVSQTLSRELELSKQLRSERKMYEALADQMKQVSSQLKTNESVTTQEPESEPLTDSETRLEGESDTIEQFLIAVKVLGGYDFVG